MREEEAGGSGKPALGHCLNYSPSLTPPHPCATKGPLMDNPSVPRPDIDAILNPGSIAIVGASTHPAKQGHTYVSALREFGFQGQVYPINPKAEEVAGYTCYPSLKDVPGPVDYVISAVPRSPSTSSHEGRPRQAGQGNPPVHRTDGRDGHRGGTCTGSRHHQFGKRAWSADNRAQLHGLVQSRSRHLLQTKPSEAARPRGIPQPERRQHGGVRLPRLAAGRLFQQGRELRQCRRPQRV